MFDVSIIWLIMALAGVGLLVSALVQAIRKRREPGWKARCGNLGCAGLMLLFIPMVCGPVFDSARSKSRMGEPCRSNLMRLALGISIYAQDYDERLPPADRWCDAIPPYVNDPDLFHCPEDRRDVAYSYAMNANLSSLKLGAIPHPSEVILLFDSHQGVKNAADVGQSLRSHCARSGARPTRPHYRFFGMRGIIIRDPPSNQSSESPWIWLPRGPNVVFVSGYVKRLGSDEVSPPGTGMWSVEGGGTAGWEPNRSSGE